MRILLHLPFCLLGLLLSCGGGGGSTTGNVTQPPSDPNAPVGTFTSAGNMATPRFMHAATLLPNGKVLVIGGANSTVAETYDPGTGTFSPAGNLPNPLNQTYAVLLTSGKVLVSGTGMGGMQLYDPAIQRFTAVSGSTAYSALPSAALADGRAILTNGSQSFLYNPSTNSVSAGPNLSVNMNALYMATPIRLGDGRVLFTDGTTSELFQPSTNSFQPGPTLGSFTNGEACLLPDGRVLIMTGYSACFFNPGNNSATAIPGPFPVSDFLPDSLTLLSSGKVLVHELRAKKFWVFDPATQKFQATPTAITPENYAFSATPLAAGGALIAGGLGAGSTGIARTEVYR